MCTCVRATKAAQSLSRIAHSNSRIRIDRFPPVLPGCPGFAQSLPPGFGQSLARALPKVSPRILPKVSPGFWPKSPLDFGQSLAWILAKVPHGFLVDHSESDKRKAIRKAFLDASKSPLSLIVIDKIEDIIEHDVSC